MDKGPDVDSQYSSCFFVPCNICQNSGDEWWYVFIFFQCEGWLHSTCTHIDKRCWTASKAMSVSLPKSHWQTWSIVHTDGTWKWDLFARGRKGSLVWQDYYGELPAYLAVTASSHALQEACFTSPFFFLQAMFVSWRCAALVSCVLSGAPAASAALALLLGSPWAAHCEGASCGGWAGRWATVTVVPLLMLWRLPREANKAIEATFPCRRVREEEHKVNRAQAVSPAHSSRISPPWDLNSGWILWCVPVLRKPILHNLEKSF